MSEIISSDVKHRPQQHNDDVDDDLKQKYEADEDVLKFMDSLDSYLFLLDSLSSTLRQVLFPSLFLIPNFYVLWINSFTVFRIAASNMKQHKWKCCK